MESIPPLIEADQLTRVYSTGGVELKALDRVSFSIADGEFVSIMGTSGSGKSTLLHILGCLDTPTEGSLAFDGSRVDGLDDDGLSLLRGRKIGFVFQAFNLIAQLDVFSNVELPLIYGRSALRRRRERVLSIIDVVGLGHRLHHLPTQLSGGQAQRVAIARALVNRPRLLLADEPTGNLDSETGKSIMGLFQALNKAGLSIVMVTHDVDLAKHSSRILRLSDGRLISDEVIRNPRRIDLEPALARRIAGLLSATGDVS